MISIQKDIFHLITQNTAYIIRVLPSGYLGHVYYGRNIFRMGDYSFLYDENEDNGDTVCLGRQSYEYSGFGRGDFRKSPIMISDGTLICDFKYESHELLRNKPEIPGLPYADDGHGENKTLVIRLADCVLGAVLELYYTVYEKCDVITRSARIINIGDAPFRLDAMMSYQIDLMPGDYSMVCFGGEAGGEMGMSERRLTMGQHGIGGLNGAQNPFFIIKSADCRENTGECYGFNLIYSGPHQVLAEASADGHIRVMGGINPDGFEWNIKPGESFCAPEAVLSFSHSGLNGLSRGMHDFANSHIISRRWRGLERPVMFNTWGATGYAFDEGVLLSLAKKAAALGMEYFVVGDGWSGGSTGDKHIAGDWKADRSKLPGGLKALGRKIQATGLKLGLCIEPEAVSADSEVYKEHSDWVISALMRTPLASSGRLLLDLTRENVREHVIETVRKIIKSGNLGYVRWDMLRSVTDMYSPRLEGQGGFMHKYIMGLYKILERLTAEFPDVLFESAGPSVGRFNLGMLAYMPLMSAGGGEGVDSNLMARRAASYGYPVSCLSSHICEDRERLEGASALEHGFNAAAFGALGYQLNLNAIKKPNIKAITKQIEFYKKNRALLQYGALLRADTALGDAIRWQVVSEGMSEAIMGVYPNDAMRLSDAPRIKFLGLDPEKVYTLSSRRQVISIKDNDGILPFIKRGLLISGQAFAKNRTYIEQQSFLAGGDALMYVGFKPRETVLGEQAAGLAVNGSRVYHVGVTG